MISGTINGGRVGGDLAVSHVTDLSPAGEATRSVWLMNWDGTATRGVKVEFSQDESGQLQARAIKSLLTVNANHTGSIDPDTLASTTDVATSDNAGHSGIKNLSLRGVAVIDGYLGTSAPMRLDNAFALSEGEHRYAVRQIDAAGNTATSAEQRFELDTRAAKALTLALADDTGLGGADTTTLDTTTRDATLRTPGGLEDGATAQYRIRTTAAGKSTTTGSSADFGAWTEKAPLPSTDGSYEVQARQVDRAGNASAPVTLGYTLDTRVDAPRPVLAQDTGRSDTDGITRQSAVHVGAVERGARWSWRVDDGDWIDGKNLSLATLQNSALADSTTPVALRSVSLRTAWKLAAETLPTRDSAKVTV